MVTPLQLKIYKFIQEYTAEHGYSPSLVEMTQALGISPKSVSLVSRSIHALVAAGKLTFDRKGYRNIKVVTQQDVPFSLPLMGRIAAGVPIEAIEDRQSVDFGGWFTPEDHFVLEVKGDSMVDSGILDGDFVICQQGKQAQEGDIVVALIEQHEATLKQISYKIPDRLTLIPANKAMKPKAYLLHHVQIQGVFVGLFRLNK